jgi:tetratricopeptide (TPR) repeat protein
LLEDKAKDLIKQQDYESAYNIYLQLIRQGNASQTLLSNIGAIALMRADWEAAVNFCIKAVTIDKNCIDAWINLGVAYRAMSRIGDSIVCFDEAIRIDPNNAVAHNNLAISLKQQNNIESAISHYLQAVRLNEEYHEAYFNLGIAYSHQGDKDSAIKYYIKSLSINSRYKEAHFNLGLLYMGLREYVRALNSFKNALDIDPDYCEVISSLGDLHRSAGELDLAALNYHRLSLMRPTDLSARLRLAEMKKKLNQTSEALNILLSSLDVFPQDIDLLNDIGLLYFDLNDLESAIYYFEKGTTIDPAHAGITSNLAMVLEAKGCLQESNLMYKKALSCDPLQPEANSNLGLQLLLIGEYEEGWPYYEWRFAGSEQKLVVLPSCPPLKIFSLDQSLNLLVVAEQGLGDTLQFMRYLSIISSQVNRLYFCPQPPLIELIRVSGLPLILLSPEEAELLSEAVWFPLLNLPRYLHVEPSNPVTSVSYIHTRADFVDKWKAVFDSEKRPIIAINWQGNPNAEQTSAKGRSIPLQAFAPLAELANIKLLSLQKGYGSEQFSSCEFSSTFVDFQPQISATSDFCETAAVIKNCRLVITSDTSIAHLSAGMGHPTWLLLKKIPDWRWGLDGSSSFWYPSMRIFRQSANGDWLSLMKEVKDELVRFLESDCL